VYIYIDKVTIYYIYTQILLATREFYQVSVKVEDLVGPMEAPWRRGRDGKNPLEFLGKMTKHMETTWKNHGNCQVKRMNMMEHDGKMMEHDEYDRHFW
jgi:hypothetical protein